MRVAVPFHRFPEEFQCGLAIPALSNEAVENLPFMIDSPRKIVLLPIYVHEHFIQVPLPMCPRTHSVHPSPTDFSSKHRTKAVPPEPHRLVADIDATFMQQILDIAE